MTPRSFHVAARAEPITLLLLLANLCTLHLASPAAVLGPTHGFTYLFVALTPLRMPTATPATRLLAFVPAIGGLLVLRRIAPTPAAPAGTAECATDADPEVRAGGA